LVVFGLNQLIGSNDMFVAHKPATASLLDVLAPYCFTCWQSKA
jgi:uncharacterized membrane protein YwaF